MQSFSLKQTVDYLLKSHRYYNLEKIPQIETLIDKSEWQTSEQSKHKELIVKFFEHYKKEAASHIQFEEKHIYPYVLFVEAAFLEQKLSSELRDKIKHSPVRKYKGEHDELNTALFDLKNIIIKYLPPADNPEITIQILTEIFRLEKDMQDHTRIEDKVLLPKVQAMENELLKLGVG